MLHVLNKLNYCILHGWQGLPEYLPSDLDIVVAPEDLSKLEKALLEANGARLVNLLQHESACYYFVLALQEDKKVRFLLVDAATDYRRDGRVWFTAEDLLKGQQRWKDFLVAAPEVEFKYLLVKKILKGLVPENSAKRLRELAGELGDKAREQAVEFLGNPLGEQVFRWIETGTWEEFQNHIPALQKALKTQKFRKDPLNPLRYWLPEIRRVWQRLRYPTGFFVVVLGPDGSGKSTLIAHLERELKGAFRRTAIFHLMPGLLRKGANGGPVTDPHGQPPRSLPASLLKLFYYLLDYNLGYWLKVLPALVKSTLVLFDRYYDDLLVDPKRYRYGGSMWLARRLRRLIPRPDLWFILDVPEDEILRRKQEVSPEEIRRQREAYRRLAIELPNAFLLDGALPPEEVARQAREIALDHLRQRYLNRRRRWFPKARKDDLGWLETALGAGTTPDGKPFLHLALPDGRGYFLPANSRQTALQALSLYAPQKPKARLAKGLVRLGLKTGIARYLLPEVRLDLDELRRVLEEVFRHRDLSLAVSLGTPGPHRKPVLQVLTKEGDVLGYVKVGWNEATKALVRNEVRAVKILQDKVLPFDIPRLLYLGELEDKVFCVQGSPPTGGHPAASALTGDYVKALCGLIETGVRRQPLEETAFWLSIANRVEKIENVYWRHMFLKAADTVKEQWKGKEVPLHFAHGDFAPWNAFQVDRRLYLYDWEYAQEEMPAGYDLFHFAIQTLLLVKDYTAAEIVRSITQLNWDSGVLVYWNLIGTEKNQFYGLFKLYCIERILKTLSSCHENQQLERGTYVETFSLMSLV
jgi:thymidylate kinase